KNSFFLRDGALRPAGSGLLVRSRLRRYSLSDTAAYYFTPPIIAVNLFENTNITAPAAIGSRLTRQNSVSSGNDSYMPAMVPARKLPTDAPRNQTPIIAPTIFGGASFVIELRPTGLMSSSAIV